MGAAAAAGDITPKDISILLFNNTFLFDFPPVGAPLVPGFHGFDFQEPNKFYVMAFVSWVTPGLLLPLFVKYKRGDRFVPRGRVPATCSLGHYWDSDR
jgi:hypothetical protein